MALVISMMMMTSQIEVPFFELLRVSELQFVPIALLQCSVILLVKCYHVIPPGHLPPRSIKSNMRKIVQNPSPPGDVLVSGYMS